MGYTDQSDVGEIVAFSDHLRTDENVNFPGVHIPVHSGKRVFASGGVPVEPCCLGIWEQFVDFFLKFLGAKTTKANYMSIALYTVAGHSRLEIAIVAEQLVFLTVKGEGDTAMRTF